MGWSDFTDFISDGISQDKSWLGLSSGSSDDSSDDSTTPTSLSGLWDKIPSSTQQLVKLLGIGFVVYYLLIIVYKISVSIL